MITSRQQKVHTPRDFVPSYLIIEPFKLVESHEVTARDFYVEPFTQHLIHSHSSPDVFQLLLAKVEMYEHALLTYTKIQQPCYTCNH